MRKKAGFRIKRKPLPNRQVWFITFFCFVFSSVIGIWVVNKAIEPTLMRSAESETKKFATVVINHAINETITDEIDLNDVIKEIPKKGNEMSVEGMQFNTEIINRIRADTTLAIQKGLTNVEHGKAGSLKGMKPGGGKESEGPIIYQIPLGKVTNNALLGNLGPKIPVEFGAISDVQSDILTTVEPYGINNALIKVNLQVEVHAQVIIPFASKPTVIKTTVPIAMGITSGKVPSYYNGNSSGVSPSIQIPTK